MRWLYDGFRSLMEVEDAHCAGGKALVDHHPEIFGEVEKWKAARGWVHGCDNGCRRPHDVRTESIYCHLDRRLPSLFAQVPNWLSVTASHTRAQVLCSCLDSRNS